MLSVREIQEQDIQSIMRYWMNADNAFLQGMGVDATKMPAWNILADIIAAQLLETYEQKNAYCVIWLANGEAVGHCNTNQIVFGEEAHMHLHLWPSGIRKQGYGTALVKQSLPYFFTNLKLNRLYCAPYALNPAPNKTLARVGFQFVKQYTGVPGTINFEQEVNVWELSREAFAGLHTA